MSDDLYGRFGREELILRDELAIDRTLLANERTLLAYLRSSVALVIGGLTIYHFSTTTWFTWLGLACLPAGVVSAWIGTARYRKMDRAIRGVRERQTAMERGKG